MCSTVNLTTFIPDTRQDRDGQCQKRAERSGKLIEEGSMLCKNKSHQQVTQQEPEDETGHLSGHQNIPKYAS